MDPGERILVALSGILVFGVGSQWIGGRLRIPSILILLLSGVLAGPVTGLIDPDALFGEILLPIVSLSVAVILFEGAMTLRISELNEIGRPLFLLLTVGVIVTGVLSAAGAYFLLDFNLTRAILLGAILTVTGPTVVGPLLQHIRPVGRVGPLARWEGIVVDPIGAVLAVLAFGGAQAVEVAPLEDAAMSGLIGFVQTFLTGAVLGLMGAGVLWLALKKHLVSDHLQNPVALMLVVLVFSASNLLHHESGLVAVTVMGLLLANQHQVSVGHIVRFKENLSVLLISSLFIVLTARLDLSQFVAFSWRGPAFVVFLLLVVRPASVMVSTIGCGLTMAERLFLSWLAPRGIVAAAVASVFALELGNADDFVAAAFLVIVGTVVVYGLTAGPLARRLGLSVANPQGVLIASAHPGARAIASALQAQGFPVCLVDTNAANTRVARMEGLPTLFANILSEDIHDLELGGLGRMLALTRNDEVNLLAVARAAELFGGRESYRLSINSTGTSRRDAGHDVLAGRVLFSDDATYDELDRRFAAGHTIKATRISEEFTMDDFQRQYPEALMLFVASGSDKLTILTTDATVTASAGQTVIALVGATASADDSGSDSVSAAIEKAD
ncbi:MAG: cation:proton antiporter [Planctomycetaceae bacterium]|nr:cation:proton antiporter [Planctomycetaceae bacterium]